MNFDEIIKRLLSKKGKGLEKDAADLLGISKQDLSNRKKRGTLLPLIVEWAVHENVDLQWLIMGEEKEEGKNRKYQIFDRIEEWLDTIKEEEEKKKIWFEIQFNESFPGFKKWEEKQKEEEQTQTYKVG